MYEGKSILICGNGPSLPSSVSRVRFADFDYIARINNWVPSEDVGDRVDIWITTFWMDITIQNILKHRDKMVWDCFLTGFCFDYESEYRLDTLKRLGKHPDFFLQKQQFDYFREKLIKIPSPSCGMYAIYMALLKKMKITIAGFDFFKKEKHHYFDEQRPERVHRGKNEEFWVNNLVYTGQIKKV